MRPSAARSVRVLLREALADAARRRIAFALAGISLLALLAIDSCTSCGSSQVIVNGKPVELSVAGWGGLVLYTSLCSWTVALAGVLAADHLAEPLADGSATLALARPLGRGTFALARLAGALLLAFAAGAVLLGACAVELHAHYDLPLTPAVWAGAACALGAISVAGLAMAASLALSRIATSLLALAAVAAVLGANTAGLLGRPLGGVLGILDRFGPPLASAVVRALAPWIAPSAVPGDPLELGLRLVLWAGGGVLALVAAFRRLEIS